MREINMTITFVLEFFMFLMVSVVFSTGSDPVIVTREEWHARPPRYIEEMTNPVPFVVIHHSYQPAVCYNLTECVRTMQLIQDMHQISNNWADIGYSFAVGGDGRAYEGRGWSRVGAHAPRYNSISVGICIIGDWTDNLPAQNQLDAVKELIQMGVKDGKIMKNYKLIGHRQVRNTECPGDRLFEEIKTWNHFCENPENKD